MLRWTLLACAVLSEVSASLSLKAALDDPGWYALVVVGYVAAFALLAGVLRTGMPLGVAYGVWAACGVALTALGGAVVFDEPIGALSAFGIALVIGGVLLVELGAQHAGEPEAAAASSASPSATEAGR